MRVLSRLALAALLSAGCRASSGAPTPLTSALSVSVSSTHACALLADGEARCWGEDLLGQLGDGKTATAVATAVRVSGVDRLKAVVAGAGYSCGLRDDGGVLCWGDNAWGEVDVGALTAGHLAIPTPTIVGGLGTPVDALATPGAGGAGSAYSCGTVRGVVQCWGQNSLGLGATSATKVGPTQVPGLSAVRSTALGGFFGCFAVDDGSVSCFGLGPNGNPGPPSPAAPTTVPGVARAVAVAAGRVHACALIGDGSVQCWGDWRGGMSVDSPAEPVDGVAGARAIAAGGNQTCAVLSDGSVVCWGLGIASPTVVEGLAPAASVSVGDGTACAVVTGGSIQCWGSNAHGLLGHGDVPAPGASGGTRGPATVVAGGQ